MNKDKIINLIKIPCIRDDGYLIFAQNPDQIPFPIKRVYYVMDADINLVRGCHAHKKTRQILFCIRGSINMVLDDGQRRESIILNQPEIGILLDKMIWHEMHDFKKNTVLLVLASKRYDASDYIRDYKIFVKSTKK